jgi:hypothetical protein
MSIDKKLISRMLLIIGLFGQSGRLFAQEPAYFALERGESTGLVLKLKGPAVPSDTKQIDLKINSKDVEDFLANRAQPRIETIPNSNVYRKISGFDNLSVAGTLNYIHTQQSEETNLLDPAGSLVSEITLPASGFVKEAVVNFGGDVTTEECLPSGACSVLRVDRNRFSVSTRFDAISDFEDLIVSNDRGVVIRKRISDTSGSSYDLQINDKAAKDALSLGSSLMTGQGARTGVDFVGARGILQSYGYNTNGGGESFKTVHVFPVGNGLRVQVVTEPYYLCRFTFNGESYFTFPQKRGRFCGAPGFSVSSRPGQDERTEKVYDFFGLSYP